jgi:hypothetical protein
MSNVPRKELNWIETRKKYHLSHAHIQMARELGMNPAKFGKLANHRQEPWKAPLPDYIEHLYFKRFGKRHPDTIRSIEDTVKDKRDKKAAKREKRRSQQLTEDACSIAQEGQGADTDITQ